MSEMNVPAAWVMRVRPAFLGVCIKRALRIERRLVVTQHGTFFLDPLTNFGVAILTNGVYEPPLTAAVKQILQPGDTFIDLGANEGYFSVIASKIIGPTGRVISIEPQTRLQPVLIRNLIENQAFNVLTVPRAIADCGGAAELFLNPDINSGSSGLVQSTKYRVPTETVLKSTLSSVFAAARVDRAKLMKMDIEGYEYEAILGSPEVFRSGIIDHLSIDFQPKQIDGRGKSIRHLFDFLSACEYAPNSEFEACIWSHASVPRRS